MAPASALSVNFQSGGMVTEIDVKPGDQVKAGQTLAKIDDTQTQAALTSAQAALTSAQANLTNVQQPLTAPWRPRTRPRCNSAQQAVATAQANIGSSEQSAAVNAAGYQNAVNQAAAQLNRDTNQFATDQATCAMTTATTTGSGVGGGQSCASQLASDQTAIAKDHDAVTNANQQQAAGQLKDQQSIQQAENSLVVGAGRPLLDGRVQRRQGDGHAVERGVGPGPGDPGPGEPGHGAAGRKPPPP